MNSMTDGRRSGGLSFNSQALHEDGHLPPIRLDDGRSIDAHGSVIVDGVRLTVPQARRLYGVTRASGRIAVGHSKRQATALLLGLLAGPVIEEHFRATEEGNGRRFDWRDELDEEDGDGDVTNAIAIAEGELCRGWRQVVAYMQKAVATIEAKLDCDARYWRTVVALADALEARLRLDHDEAVDVMRAAWGQQPDGGSL